MAGLGLAASAVAWLLNLPWSSTWAWEDLAAPPLAGPTGRGLVDVASMAIGLATFEVVALALYVPVLVALAIARAWRLTWAARGAALVIVFLGLAVLQDRDASPVALPDIGLLLVPVALGLALTAASAVAAFSHDIAGRRFGWRQPLGLAGVGAVAVGLVPALFTIADGAWFTPRSSLVESVEGPLPPPAEVGDYRVLYLGDPRLIPYPSDDLGDGVAVAVVDDGGSDLRDRWSVPEQSADEELHEAIEQIASSATLRGGRLLAPFGVQFIVVPLLDGANSTASDPLPVPSGLVAALDVQLDLARSPVSPPSFVLFDNRASIPTAAVLEGPLAEASRADEVAGLVAVDTSTATPALVGADTARQADGDLPAGVLHFGTPPDDGWQLNVAESDVAGRTAFGVTSAFDVATAGTAELRYDQPLARTLSLVAQGLLWVLVILAASRLTVPARLRPHRARDETLIDLDAEPGAALPDRTGFAGWAAEPLANDNATGSTR